MSHPTRRTLIASLAGGATTAALLSNTQSPHAATKAAAPRIRWAQGWLLWRSQKLPLKQALSDLAAVGADGIEYSPGDGDPEKQGFTQQELLDLLKEKKLAVSGMYFAVKSHAPSDLEQVVSAARKRIAAMKAYNVGFMVMSAPEDKPATTERTETIKQLGKVLNEVGRIARPVRQLRHFEKQPLAAGQSREFAFDIDPRRDLSYPDGQGRPQLEAGWYTLRVGSQTVRFRYAGGPLAQAGSAAPGSTGALIPSR